MPFLAWKLTSLKPCSSSIEVYCIESMLQKNALDTIYQKCPILYYGTPINERIYGPSFSLLKDYGDIHLSPLFQPFFSNFQCQNCYASSFMSIVRSRWKWNFRNFRVWILLCSKSSLKDLKSRKYVHCFLLFA